jgi:hypothetical protein
VAEAGDADVWSRRPFLILSLCQHLLVHDDIETPHREDRLVVAVLRHKRERARAAGKREQLAVRDLALAVCAASAGEQQDLVARRTARVETAGSSELRAIFGIEEALLHTRLGEGRDDQGKAGLVVVLAGGEHVPLLAGRAITSDDLDGSEVVPGVHQSTDILRHHLHDLPEVTRARHDLKALLASLDRHSRERARRSSVPLLGLGGCSRVERDQARVERCGRDQAGAENGCKDGGEHG